VSQSRPFGVTLLSLLAWLQAIIAGYHTLQFAHILPFSLGPMTFFGFDFLAAVLWGLTTAIYVWAAIKLWQLDIQGWMFAAMLAGWILILDILEAVGATPLSAVLPSMIVSGLVLLYCLLPGTRDHFSPGGVRSVPAASPAPQTPAS
jgi:hypothetical protein